MPNPKFNKNWDNKRHSRFKKGSDRAPFNKRPYIPRAKHTHNYTTLSEKEVGITEYVSDLTGFPAVIKARYSDFHVNEIDLSGNIAKLTDLTAPAVEKIEEEIVERPEHLITEDTWDRIKAIAETNDETEETVEIDVAGFSKEDRTIIHKIVTAAFPKRIITKTVAKDDNKKSIRITQYQKYLKHPHARQDNRIQLPAEYTHFLLYKEGIDTLHATYKISSKLRMKASAFAYAGVKDRRAKTTQWLSVRRVAPEKLLNCTKVLQNVRLGNVCFKEEPLKLGQLRGNRFRIALRNVCAEDGLIESSLEAVKSKGFINYYGLQRFGNAREAPTFEIGIKLMQGEWKAACDLILKLTATDDPSNDITEAKKVYKDTGDAKKALLSFTHNENNCVEAKLLQGMAKHNKNDYVNALENVPRNMRLLYIHSFQSLIWNVVLSRRIKELGLKPVAGDLVLISEVESDNSTLEEAKEDIDMSNETAEKSYQKVKVLTEADLPNHTIYDIVLPLPGYDVQYPENQTKDWYQEGLTRHGLTLQMEKQRVKTYTLSGTYRKAVCRIEDITWKVMRYDDPNDSLILSDLEQLKGKPEPLGSPEGKYKALVLEFSLSSSSYATMVLREFLKVDTSTTEQMKMNNYHETKPAEVDHGSKPVEIEMERSLLAESDKYEAFMKKIMDSDDDDAEGALKRPADDDPEEGDKKKLKTKGESSDKVSGIAMEPSCI